MPSVPESGGFSCNHKIYEEKMSTLFDKNTKIVIIRDAPYRMILYIPNFNYSCISYYQTFRLA